MIVTKSRKAQKLSLLDNRKPKSRRNIKASSSRSSSTSSLDVKDLNGNDMCMGYFSMLTVSSSKLYSSSGPQDFPTEQQTDVARMPSTIFTRQQNSTALIGGTKNAGQQKTTVSSKEDGAYAALLPEAIATTKYAVAAPATIHPSSDSNNIASARSMLFKAYLQALEDNKTL